jgi:ABC-type multidrug transport system ATPase subunit
VSVAAIHLEDVRHAYGKGPAVLVNVDLQVAEGEIHGLVGADGAGKSTLLSLCIGQLPLQGGEIEVLGRKPSDPALRDEIAYMPQGFGLYMDLSVQENVAFFADLHGLLGHEAGRRVADLLARTGLHGFEGRRAGALSGGMMQKLALACALVAEPRAMFLDEPTTGVDPLSRRSFWKLLDRVRTDGVAILYATANMDEAERCDKVSVLEQGRVTHQGTPAGMVAAAGAPLVGVSGPGVRERRGAIRALPGVRLAFPVGPALKVWLLPDRDPQGFAADLAAVAPGCEVKRLYPTLNDLVLRDLAVDKAREDRAAAG